MTSMKLALRGALLVAAAAAYSSCAPTTVHEVTVVHTHPKTVHHTRPQSTAPENFGVVNQYDRQSR